jgi:hypothetical protein
MTDKAIETIDELRKENGRLKTLNLKLSENRR